MYLKNIIPVKHLLIYYSQWTLYKDWNDTYKPNFEAVMDDDIQGIPNPFYMHENLYSFEVIFCHEQITKKCKHATDTARIS